MTHVVTPMGEDQIHYLEYEDGLLLIARSQKSLQCMFTIRETLALEYGMILNPSKIQLLGMTNLQARCHRYTQ